MKKPASGAVLTAHRRLMDSVVGETTYVKAAEDMGDSIMPSMWPRNMQTLLGTDRRKKRLDPQPTGINWLGTTTTSTTAAPGSVFLKEHTFVDLNHLQVLLKPASSEEESDPILAPQQQHSSNQQVALRELYSDKQAKSLSLLQQKLRVLNIQRQEAERELLLDDQALVYEPTTVYKTDSALQNHQISSKTERKQQLFQESRHSNEEEEEGTPAGSRNSSESGAQQQLQPVEEDDHDKQTGQQDWRERARALSKLLSESTKREAVLSAKLEALSTLQKRITTTATSPPSPPPPPPSSWLQQQPHLEHKQLRQQQQRDNMRRCCDSYLRFALRTAPIVVGHQDMELRYRFIYNAFPSLTEEEIIGKTDMEIYKGKGVSELTEFKYEVLRKGCPEKREIEFDTDLFGTRTFLIAVEPVCNLSGDAIGINFWAMDVTEQAEKRDRMASLREQVAVQKAMETELNKTIHITEETMQAKEMLVTMSHEIRSPLSGVVSMAEVLATTDLDTEQRQLVDVMVSSGDLVLQLINNILDLSKVQSGAMKFEAKKFQLREVVKHVLQMAHASIKNKSLVLEADIHPNVPLELIGDVLRIHQVFINLVSNAIKFTHNGGVTIAIQVVSPDPPDLAMEKSEEEKLPSLLPWSGSLTLDAGSHKTQIPVQPNLLSGQKSPNELSNPTTTAEEVETIWLQCDIHDTGIGIPGVYSCLMCFNWEE
jgi:signal transduction histidine kinase